MSEELYNAIRRQWPAERLLEALVRLEDELKAERARSAQLVGELSEQKLAFAIREGELLAK